MTKDARSYRVHVASQETFRVTMSTNHQQVDQDLRKKKSVMGAAGDTGGNGGCSEEQKKQSKYSTKLAPQPRSPVKKCMRCSVAWEMC